MGWLFIGAGVLALGLYALHRYTKGDPRKMAEFARKYYQQAGGVAILGLCAFLVVRGRWEIAIFLAPIGLGLMKTGPWASGPWARNTSKAEGQRSTVRSAHIEMTLDHDTGAMAGRVLAGRFAGRELDALPEADLAELAREIGGDEDGRALLEAYLDRRFPGRREHVEDDPGARQRSPGPHQAMTEEEAHQILGLQPGADAEAIKAAHRALMKRLHPDHGGSTWLAAKINTAKDLLLSRHR